jgi:RNA-directed DNA polymerase
MRSHPAGSFERLSQPQALWVAWLQCRKGKRRRPTMAAFDLDADRAVFLLHRRLRDSTYRPQPYRLRLVHDPKTRLIACSTVADRVVQTALLNEIAPTFERGFIDQSYACRLGRGPHRAVLAYLQATRHCRYRLSLDIRRYFASIDHSRLLQLFSHRVHDAATLALLRLMIETGGAVYHTDLALKVLGKPTFTSLGLAHQDNAVGARAREETPGQRGMPLGSALSHWSGALYLDGLDHHIKRTLKIKFYQRYMDDMTLFHDDHEVLEHAHAAIAQWLRVERGLELNPAAVYPTRQPSTYLGFRVSAAGLAPGPKAKRRLRLRLRQESVADAPLKRSLKAYRGMLLSIG